MNKETCCPDSIKDRLANASDADILASSEAVVDAAINCLMHGDYDEFPMGLRRKMVNRVLAKPLWTKELFNQDFNS